MKLFLLLPFIIFTLSANATDYYVSANGNDANSGTSTSTPWRTLDKINSYFGSLQPGDRVLLNRGDVFYGSITVSKSGTSGSPITIGAYGSGAKPVVTGFTDITSWVNLGGNIWESSNTISSLSDLNVVTVENKIIPMGRYPNSGYITYQSHSGNSSITSNALSSSPYNWAGASVVIKKERWALEKGTIVSQYGSTINYFDKGAYIPTDGFGFFIQNDSRTLDQQNEWYYNPTTKKLRIYSTSSPLNVNAATIDILLYASGSYVTIDNLSFQGANNIALSVVNPNVTISNCDILYSSTGGIFATYASNLMLSGNFFNWMGGTSIRLASAASNAVIQNNTIKNSGMIPGMTLDLFHDGISSNGYNTLIQYNNIDSSGYNGITFDGASTKIKNNFINHSCALLDDGAGIYTAGVNTAREITGNIVLNTIGVPDGTNQLTNFLAHGIHLDGGTKFVTVSGNTVSGCRGAGFFIQLTTDAVITGNTSYDNGVKDNWLKGAIMFQYGSSVPIKNLTINNNIFFAKTLDQLSVFYYAFPANLSDLLQLGTSNYNYYTRPLNENNIINVQDNTYNLAGWQALIGQDYNSKGSPKSVNSTDSLRFEYNATLSSETIPLDANYIDVKGASYNGSITLAPYSSAILIKNGPAIGNQPPIAYAGADSTVTLPVNTSTLIGSGAASNGNGSITNYLWTKISGPSVTIVSPNSATTSLSGLTEGSYQFQLMVTDNNGATAKATVQVTVNPVQVQAPVSLLPAVNPSNTVNGLDYGYFEAGSYSVLPSFSSLTPVKTGTVSTFDISPANRNTAFSFNFTGYINVPADGQYTFYTNSDDGSSLYIDGVLVVTDNDGIHGPQERSGTIGLQAGKHAIAVGYFQQGGGTVLSVNYAGPGISKQVIPTSALYRVSTTNLLPAVNPLNTVNGLDYNYYEANSFTSLPSFSSLTPVKTGTVSTFDISPANRNTSYSFNFTGYINVPSDGQYTFYTNSDDGSNLYIDGVLVVSDNDGIHGPQERSGTIGLQAGKHAISVGYFQQGGGTVLSVNYGGPGISKQSIPVSALYRVSANNLLPAVYLTGTVNGLDYKYYEANSFTSLPSFGSLTPVKTGTVSNFDLSPANRNTSYSFNFIGYIDVPYDGQYTFYTDSDDGSNLYIDNVPVVTDNDGIHGPQQKLGTIGLQAGKHAISVGYFQQGGGILLNVYYSAVGVVKQLIPASSLYRVSTGSRFNNNDRSATIPAMAIVTDSTTSSISLNEVKVKAYPNPFTSSIVVSLNGDAGNYQLVLVDVQGRTLMMKNGVKSAGNYTLTLNTSSFQRGIYFLKVIQNNKSTVVKLEK